VLRRACSAWQAWLHEVRRPKAAAAQRAKQHHQAVCKIAGKMLSSSYPMLACLGWPALFLAIIEWHATNIAAFVSELAGQS